jgi:hypothetical protein
VLPGIAPLLTAAAGGSATAGPNFPTGATNTGTGSTWLTFSTGLNAADAVYAHSSVAVSGSSRVLTSKGYGFAIPGTATINGIEIVVSRLNTAGVIADSSLRLALAGTPSGTNKADTVTAWGGSQANITYGGASDLWGLTLTPTDVNDALFGVALVVANSDSSNSANAQVDYITIKVYYTS